MYTVHALRSNYQNLGVSLGCSAMALDDHILDSTHDLGQDPIWSLLFCAFVNGDPLTSAYVAAR